MVIRNIFSEIPNSMGGELFEILIKNEHFMLERIISSGQATPLESRLIKIRMNGSSY